MDIDSTEVYQQMWHRFVDGVESNRCQYDALIGTMGDTRIGISVLAYLKDNQVLTLRLADLQRELQQVEPGQYYCTDPHVTVFSIISRTSELVCTPSELQHCCERFSQAVSDTPCFELHFSGLSASPTSVIAKGYVSDDALIALRERLRVAFADSPLRHHLEGRYRNITAHATLVRFCSPLDDPLRLRRFIEAHRECWLGSYQVSALDLTLYNWFEPCTRSQRLSQIPLLASSTWR
jgi:2'-5' RNA ligase